MHSNQYGVCVAGEFASVGKYIVPAGDLGLYAELAAGAGDNGHLPFDVIVSLVCNERKVQVAAVVIDSSPAGMPAHQLNAVGLHVVQSAFAPCVLIAPYDHGVGVYEEVERNALQPSFSVKLKYVLINGKILEAAARIADKNSVVHTRIILQSTRTRNRLFSYRVV